MKSKIIGLVALGLLAGPMTALAVPAYMTGSFDPWNRTGNDAAMDAVFGAGNWTKYQGFSAAALAGHELLVLDGGDGVSGQFENFINANRAGLEAYVANGGRLIINAARWTSPDLDLGFGVTLNYGLNDPNSGDFFSASAVGPHGIIDGPMGTTGTAWTGNYFAHDYLTGAGLNTILINAGGQSILAELFYGGGYVMFGGLTDPGFHSPSNLAVNLRENMFAYAANVGVRVPEPGTLALLGLGLAGLGLSKRRRAA